MPEPCENLDKIALFENHIENHKGWNRVITGIVVTGLMAIISFAYGYGSLSKEVVNLSTIAQAQEQDLDRLDERTWEIHTVVKEILNEQKYREK